MEDRVLPRFVSCFALNNSFLRFMQVCSFLPRLFYSLFFAEFIPLFAQVGSFIAQIDTSFFGPDWFHFCSGDFLFWFGVFAPGWLIVLNLFPFLSRMFFSLFCQGCVCFA
jgi:hypothetical protein